jgi:hypothetical protein
MKYLHPIGFKGLRLTTPLALLISLFASIRVYGQEPPPRPITVTASTSLSFGSFSQGASGGTVTVPANGVRIASGDVILLNMTPSYSAAVFEVVGNPGTMVSILSWPAGVLSGTPSGSMTLQINTSYPTPFVINTTPPFSTLLYIGGVLTVLNPGSNPPGSYTGTFNITFIQE